MNFIGFPNAGPKVVFLAITFLFGNNCQFLNLKSELEIIIWSSLKKFYGFQIHAVGENSCSIS